MRIIKHDWDWAQPLTVRVPRVRYIVLHHAVGDLTAADVHRIHRGKGWAGIGYHYYIELDGDVHRGRPEAKVGAHVNEHNTEALGVCFSGDYEVRRTMPAKQLASGRELVADLRRRYPKAKVLGHRDVPDNATACPGRHFPMAEMLKEADMPKLVGKKDFPRLKQLILRYALLHDVSMQGWERIGVCSEVWGDYARLGAWRVSGRLKGIEQTAQPTRELLRALEALM